MSENQQDIGGKNLPASHSAFCRIACAAALCLILPQIANAQNATNKDASKLYLKAPIRFEPPGKKPLAPGELAALNVARIENDAAELLRQKNCLQQKQEASTVANLKNANSANGDEALSADKANTPSEAKQNCSDTGFIDLAFGAYQRGYYLSAFKLALPRAEKGDPAAQTLIAELYDKGQGIARDRKKAASWYKFAANSGNREAQFAYANILAKGKTAKLDIDGAIQFMKRAADGGHNKAQFNYAQMIINNKPNYRGFVAARPYYEKAAKSGLPDAQYALARMHATGDGFPHADLKRARKWMTLSAIGGYDTAQLELAIWMAIGKGGAKDEKAALNWFRLSANQGNVIAQNRLARMYAYGLGTKRNIIQAAAWHILARRAGKTDQELDQIFRDLSSENQKKAIKIANSWRAS